MMDGSSVSGTARIGPNAIWQIVPALDRQIGIEARQRLMQSVAVDVPLQESGMVPEGEVIRLHRAVTEALADLAPDVMREAGLATADYILANRIPAFAQFAIRAFPSVLGARVLAAAIAKHSWTFAGSGVFRIEGHRPLMVSITHNPLATGPEGACGCDWHAAVFERLFARLVWPRVKVTETACCAAGASACRFTIAAAQV